uniref:Ig-like domain-containing protein n=1 Tax=Electrophorus electricus TaxID=8005 RepID=A0A4W4HJE1_ELEEL
TSSFKVSTPSSDLIAIRGQPTVLGCEFTSEPDPSLSSLVVTWQRPEDSQVVHSFYYGQDQLERQSLNYRNRTALFVSELKRGNASLRIEGVRSKDTGMYLCLVSNMKGTGRAQVRLVYGAFYTEPRLSISASPHGVTVQYESEGFPKPEVQWVGAEDQNLSHHTELTNDSDMAGGLYHLKSIYEAHTYPLSGRNWWHSLCREQERNWWHSLCREQERNWQHSLCREQERNWRHSLCREQEQNWQRLPCRREGLAGSPAMQ